MRSAVARAFNSKLLVGLGGRSCIKLLVGLGGRSCIKLQAGNSGTAAGRKSRYSRWHACARSVARPACRLFHVHFQVPEPDTSWAAWGGRGEGDAARL